MNNIILFNKIDDICGNCKWFENCFEESSIVLKLIRVDKKAADKEKSKQVPACCQFERVL